jgi:hypothetical protein
LARNDNDVLDEDWFKYRMVRSHRLVSLLVLVAIGVGRRIQRETKRTPRTLFTRLFLFVISYLLLTVTSFFGCFKAVSDDSAAQPFNNTDTPHDLGKNHSHAHPVVVFSRDFILFFTYSSKGI